MTVFLKKFGTTLNGRQYSRESFAAFESSLRNVRNNEDVMVDFEEVITSTPSWGDEFLAPLFSRFGDRLVLKNTDNLSVLATLKLLRKIYGKDFFKE